MVSVRLFQFSCGLDLSRAAKCESLDLMRSCTCVSVSAEVVLKRQADRVSVD